MDNAAIMNDIRPLKDLIEIKGAFQFLPFILLLLLLAVAVAAFLYFKKKRRATKDTFVPARPPEEIAMEELKALREMRLPEKGMIKEYYIKISDIIRKYIEARYKVLALDRTTWELYQEMRIKKIERPSVDKIRDFLEECDLVKFAKYIPDQKEIEEIYANAKEIIGITSHTNNVSM